MGILQIRCRHAHKAGVENEADAPGCPGSSVERPRSCTSSEPVASQRTQSSEASVGTDCGSRMLQLP